MKFTGERYIPTEGGDIRQEHLHRYAWCRPLVSQQRVLDIACGEGYGSAMLARNAEAVIGVDISEEAIQHAKATYGAMPGIEFRVGDAARIPLEDDSVDLVVSFETIEHHDRHAEMISEIRRVLRPDGLLVISSPNRDVYSERAGHHNEFHVKELDFAEFDETLRKQFPSIRYFGQRLAVGSNIFPLQRKHGQPTGLSGFTDTGKEVEARASVLSDPVYFIAVAGASDQGLPTALGSSVLFSESEDLYTHHIEVVRWARRLDTELADVREKYAKAIRDGEEVSSWGQSQSKAAQEARNAVVEQQARFEEASEELESCERRLSEQAACAEELREKYAQAVSRIEEVSSWGRAQSAAAQEARDTLAEQQARLEEAFEELDGREHRLAEANDAAAASRRDSEAQRAELGELETTLERQATLLAEQRERLAAANAVVAEYERVTSTQRTELHKLEIQVEEQSARQREAADALAAHQEQLIEARGEIAKGQARLRILELQRAELDLIKASRSWRWTRPWRVLMRTLHNRGLSDLDRQRLRGMFKSRQRGRAGVRMLASPLAGDPASQTTADATAGSAQTVVATRPAATQSGAGCATPAPQQAGSRDYFVWAVIDWHFRIQRPQHLSRELAAAGHRVFYMSNNFVDDPRPGFSVEPLDREGTLFQVHLNLLGAPQIYHTAPDARQQEQLRASLGELLAWSRSRGCVSLVQHPYWLETSRVVPDAWQVYDCMDYHGGFADNGASILARENELMREADLLVVTSDWLYQETARHNRHRLMVRNGCQYDHFAHRCANPFKDSKGRRVIGYYGAIAEWFDLDLVEKVAERFADCLVLLVGNDTAGARARLKHLPNVEFTGEVSYASLPAYLDGFDVCMLPFRIIPLTLATNPVKVYEYLSAGKSVVSVALPEIRQFGDLVKVAEDHAAFVDAVGETLRAGADASQARRRQHFAAEQTWSHRATTLTEGVEALQPAKVSVIVLTYNNLDLTKACLGSVEALSNYGNLEVVIVDNASTDGTQAFLKEWAQGHEDCKLLLNADNLGFAAGNNVGLAAASGEYLVLLNNDTYVTPGWVATLVAHLRRNPKLGLVGPVTNNIGNEARIDVEYDGMDAMLDAAAGYTVRHAGQSIPLRTAAFFCAMLRREVYEQVGPLDEAFGIGFFEDDDYCRRIEQAGWAIACAEDVFIHHHLSASFNKLKQERRQELFERNKAIYEAKWGKWVPHEYRQS